MLLQVLAKAAGGGVEHSAKAERDLRAAISSCVAR